MCGHPIDAVRFAMRRFTFLSGMIACLLLAVAARSQEFAIDLDVKSGKASQSAHAEPFGLGVTPKPRSIIEVKAGERIMVKWKLTNIDSKESAKDVTVHFFVVKEEATGQRTLPNLKKDVVAESALSMDFAPKDKSEGQLNFVIDRPGSYLVRLETMGVANGSKGQEWFAALDVVTR